MDPRNSKLSVCLIAQLVDHCTFIAEVKIQVWFRPEFFQPFSSHCSSSAYNWRIISTENRNLVLYIFHDLKQWEPSSRELVVIDQLKILGLPQFSLMWSKLKWLFEIRIIKVVMTMESWWYEDHSCGILACSSVLLRFVILTTLTRKNAQHKMKPPKIFEKGFFFIYEIKWEPLK